MFRRPRTIRHSRRPTAHSFNAHLHGRTGYRRFAKRHRHSIARVRERIHIINEDFDNLPKFQPTNRRSETAPYDW